MSMASPAQADLAVAALQTLWRSSMLLMPKDRINPII